jgi:hypothetical protein
MDCKFVGMCSLNIRSNSPLIHQKGENCENELDQSGFGRYNWPAGLGLALLILGARSLNCYYLHVGFTIKISAAHYIPDGVSSFAY